MTREAKELRAIITTRKEHQKGKRLALKDKLVLTTAEILETVKELEKNKRNQQSNKRRRKSNSLPIELEIDSDDSDDIEEEERPSKRPVLDCVIVENLR